MVTRLKVELEIRCLQTEYKKNQCIVNFKMITDLKSLEPALECIRASTDKNKSLSGNDQLIQIFVGNFKVPLEVVDIIYTYLPLTFLLDVLEKPFDLMLEYPIKATFKTLKQELIGIGGYEIKKNGTVHLT